MKVEHPELVRLAAQISRAMEAVRGHQQEALSRAREAGEFLVAAQDYLGSHPLILQSFAQWFKQYVRGYSLRCASNYITVYKHLLVDSTACYPSIKAVLIAARKSRPKQRKERFVPPALMTPDEAIAFSKKHAKVATHQAIQTLFEAARKPDLPKARRPKMGKFPTILGSRVESLREDPEVTETFQQCPKVRELVDLLFADLAACHKMLKQAGRARMARADETTLQAIGLSDLLEEREEREEPEREEQEEPVREEPVRMRLVEDR